MRPLVPLILAVLLASPLTAAEIPIARPEVIPTGPLWFAGTPEVVAGDGFLLLWIERYAFSPGLIGRILARTYDGDGTPRQEVPVEVAAGHTPHAFWNGSEYVVVWSPSLSRFGSTSPAPVIRSMRLTPDGRVVPHSQQVLAMERFNGSVIDVAFDGTTALAAVNRSNVYALQTLDRDGVLIDDTPVDYVPAAVVARRGGGFFVLRREVGDAVAASRDQFGVIDFDEGAVNAKILDDDGDERQRFTLTSRGVFSTPSIAWDGAAWTANYAEHGLFCTARFSSADDVVRRCQTSPHVSASSIAALDGRTFRAWVETTSNGARLLTDRGPASTELSSSFSPSAVVDDAGLLVAWTERDADGLHIRIGGLTNDGAPRPEHGVEATTTHLEPRLARAGGQTLLVWFETGRIRAVLVGPDGAPAGEPIELGGSYASFDSAVAARGNEWLVAWTSGDGIESVRVTSTLLVTDRQHFGSAAHQSNPSIAVTQDGYLVAWLEREEQWNRVVVEPLDAQGRRTRGGNRIVETFAPVSSPDLACGPAACLLARFGDSNEVWTMLVSHDGSSLTAERRVVAQQLVNRLIVRALGDGSFRVHRGGVVTTVSAKGEPSPNDLVHRERIFLGDVLTWRGRTTLLYARTAEVMRVFAYEVEVTRARAVRR